MDFTSDFIMQLTSLFINTFCRVILQLEKLVCGSDMRTYSMNDAHDPYGIEADALGENIRVRNAETKSNGRRYQETAPNIAATMRILRVELQSYKEDNERMIKA